MKKNFLNLALIALCLICFSACQSNKININDYLIEDRQNLFIAGDNLYTITLTTGLRETNYNFDGIVGEKTDFAILCIQRNDGKNLANDKYFYTVNFNDQELTGSLSKSEVDNSYCVDLETAIPNDALITVKVSFTGYTLNKELTNITSSFNVDNSSALLIADEHLNEGIKNLLKNNANIEVVTKILTDNSNAENNNYYWYIGVISSNGETMGILIDSNSGEILAKKV